MRERGCVRERVCQRERESAGGVCPPSGTRTLCVWGVGGCLSVSLLLSGESRGGVEGSGAGLIQEMIVVVG